MLFENLSKVQIQLPGFEKQNKQESKVTLKESKEHKNTYKNLKE